MRGMPLSGAATRGRRCPVIQVVLAGAEERGALFHELGAGLAGDPAERGVALNASQDVIRIGPGLDPGRVTQKSML